MAGRRLGCGAGAPDRASCSGRGADDAPGAAGASGGRFVDHGGAVLDAGVPAAPVEAVVLRAGTRVGRGAGAPDLASDRGRGADDVPGAGGRRCQRRAVRRPLWYNRWNRGALQCGGGLQRTQVQ